MLVKRRCQVHLMMMNSHDSTGERPRQPLARLVPNPKLKFMEQCREVMRFKQLAHRTEAILFCRTKNLNNQLSTLFAVAGQRRGFRAKSNHRAWRQGGQRSRDDFAGPPEGGTPNAFAGRAPDVAGWKKTNIQHPGPHPYKLPRRVTLFCFHAVRITKPGSQKLQRSRQKRACLVVAVGLGYGSVKKQATGFKVIEGLCAGPTVCPLSRVKAGTTVCIKELTAPPEIGRAHV